MGKEEIMRNGGRNDEMNLAWQFVAQTGISVFLTGKAGTGKTTFLKKLREIMPKRMVVLAPTGVAAINAGGQTIHSFFQLPFGPYIPGTTSRESQNKRFRMSPTKKNLIKTLDLLVIDEVSMVRADLLDHIDATLRQYRDRTQPFGGVQLLLIGDLMQLSPVANDTEWRILSQYYDTPYFFSSRALKQLRYATVELRHIYRQQDEEFINILNRVRTGQIDANVVAQLNRRYIAGYNPTEAGWIRLTTHNHTAQSYNESRLTALDTPIFTYPAKIKGDFPELSYPTDAELRLREGAQVMFVKNDPSIAHRYYNGKIGTISAIHNDGIDVACDDGTVRVAPVEWQNTKFTLDPETKTIKESIEGTFTQYPLRLAWAITVHKSQGLTFDRAVLDINSAFAHGQVYVALSRCRTLDGLVLSQPVSMRSVITDVNVNAYIDQQRSAAAQSVENLPQMKYEYTLKLLDELYSFRAVTDAYGWLVRVVDEHLSAQQPQLLSSLKAEQPELQKRLVDVAERFRAQYQAYMQQSGGNIAKSPLAQRIMDSAKYFIDALDELMTPVFKAVVINIDNKSTAEIFKNAVISLRTAVEMKSKIFEALVDEPFTTSAYLNAKARTMLADAPAASAKHRAGKKEKTPKAPKAPKVEKPKPKRGDSARKSLEMFDSGMTPAEVAAERGLSVSTIYSHLIDMVIDNALDIDKIIIPAHRQAIVAAMDTFDTSYTTAEVKTKLPDDVTMGEIHAMLKLRNHGKV